MDYIIIKEEVVVMREYRVYYDDPEELADAIEEFEDSGWCAGAEYYDDEVMEALEVSLTDCHGNLLGWNDAQEIRESIGEENKEDHFIETTYA
jgi:hypothetical protein